MVLIRPWLRSGSILNDRGFSIAHRFRPIIKRTILPGAEIFPKYAKSNINRIIKAVFAKLDVADSDRFNSKCFRRGCSNAMKDADSTLGQIMRADGRSAAGYRSYLLLQRDGGGIYRFAYSNPWFNRFWWWNRFCRSRRAIDWFLPNILSYFFRD